MDIGFIGLGKMGGPMAANLIRGGHRVWAFDIATESLDRAVRMGATPCRNPREASAGRDAVFLSLTRPTIVEQTVLGEEGVLSAVPVPPLLIDTSTGFPTTTRRIAAAAREKGCQLLDAPVTGMPQGAAGGTLSIMVGGPAEGFERALPLLRLLGKEIFRVGEVGAGHTIKLVNNILTGICRVAIPEALMLGVLGGVEPETIYQVISASTGNSRIFQAMVPRVLRGDFESGGDVDVLHKDLDLAARLGQELGLPMPMVNTAKQLYQTAKAMGLGSHDAAAMVVPLEKLMGIEIRQKDQG